MKKINRTLGEREGKRSGGETEREPKERELWTPTVIYMRLLDTNFDAEEKSCVYRNHTIVMVSCMKSSANVYDEKIST